MVRNQSFDLQNTDNPRHIDRIFLQFLTEIINACLPLLLYHAVHELLVLAERPGVQHLLHLKSKSKILQPIEIMGFFYEIFCQIQGNNLL